MRTIIYGNTASGKTTLAAGIVTKIMNDSNKKNLVILSDFFTERFFRKIERKSNVIKANSVNLKRTIKEIWGEKRDVVLLLDLEREEDLRTALPYIDLFEDVVVTIQIRSIFKIGEAAEVEVEKSRFNVRFDNVVRVINKLSIGDMERGILYDMVKGNDIEFSQVSEVKIERK